MGREREVPLVAVLDACRNVASWCVSALWSRLGRRPLGLTRRRRRRRRRRAFGLGARGLNYDALSYAQNFDDGGLGECETDTDFTSRFAPARLTGGARRPSADHF